MKQMYRAGFGLAVVLSLSLFSCKENNDIASSIEKSISTEKEESENAKVEFSKALAKALQEKEVRAFLKAEALSQYDGDYDVLYALVKDKTLTNGKTFEQTLSQFAMSADFKSWSQKAPLMTIFVPALKEFSPETWNLDSQIPDVVIDNDQSKNKSGKLVAFSSDLRQYEVDSKKAPSIPVVVIKENERILAKSKLNSEARVAATLEAQKSTKVISENETHSFYFIGDVNPKSFSKANTRSVPFEQLGAPKVTYDLNVENQRDWIYYHIAPKFENEYLDDYDYTRGTMGNYTERLTGFKFNSPLAAQAVTDDWTEGSLEFHVMLSFLYRDGNMQTDLKVFYCLPEQLISNGVPIDYNPNVELMPWDMQRYGDEWKFSVLEHDAGGSSTRVISTKSNFGYNFEGSFQIFKIGVKFGTTGSFEKTSSQTITISSESDQLGDARFLYEYPVVTARTINPGEVAKYTVNSVSTGAVDLSIEPTATSPDTRPTPNNL